jgi:branched-subunit amino acid ABC-type transport system permease component
LTRTTFGWRVRAAVDDPELLACTGVRLSLLRTAHGRRMLDGHPRAQQQDPACSSIGFAPMVIG